MPMSWRRQAHVNDDSRIFVKPILLINIWVKKLMYDADSKSSLLLILILLILMLILILMNMS